MTNPFDRGSSGPNPFGQDAPGNGGSSHSPVRPPAPPAPSPAPSRAGASGPGPKSYGSSGGDNAIDAQNLDGRLQRMQKAADGMQRAREQLATLVGTGTAADGKVKVTWAAATGLDQLHIEPRAMRMASEDLAAALKQAITDAMNDLRRKTAETLQQEAGVSPNGGAKRMEEMREVFDGQMDEITSRIQSAQRTAERALMR